MRSYLNVLQYFKNHFDNDEDVNTVTSANADEVTEYKQNIYPLANVLIDSAPFSGLGTTAVSVFNVELTVLDIRDNNPEPITDKIYYNDNRQDNWNLTFGILKRAVNTLLKSDVEINGSCIELTSASDATRINGDFGEVLDGWVINLTLTIEETDRTLC